MLIHILTGTHRRASTWDLRDPDINPSRLPKQYFPLVSRSLQQHYQADYHRASSRINTLSNHCTSIHSTYPEVRPIMDDIAEGSDTGASRSLTFSTLPPKTPGKFRCIQENKLFVTPPFFQPCFIPSACSLIPCWPVTPLPFRSSTTRLSSYTLFSGCLWPRSRLIPLPRVYQLSEISSMQVLKYITATPNIMARTPRSGNIDDSGDEPADPSEDGMVRHLEQSHSLHIRPPLISNSTSIKSVQVHKLISLQSHVKTMEMRPHILRMLPSQISVLLLVWSRQTPRSKRREIVFPEVVHQASSVLSPTMTPKIRSSWT